MTVMVMGFLDQIVVRNDIVWKYFEGHLHVFIPVQGCLEIHILNVRPTKFCAGCADNTARDFGGYHVGCSDGELIRIVNQIAINFDANLIRIIIFLSFGMHCFVSCNRKR